MVNHINFNIFSYIREVNCITFIEKCIIYLSAFPVKGKQ
jgi:hypothetical protein